jgi:hypothetical protein
MEWMKYKGIEASALDASYTSSDDLNSWVGQNKETARVHDGQEVSLELTPNVEQISYLNPSPLPSSRGLRGHWSKVQWRSIASTRPVDVSLGQRRFLDI